MSGRVGGINLGEEIAKNYGSNEAEPRRFCEDGGEQRSYSSRFDHDRRGDGNRSYDNDRGYGGDRHRGYGGRGNYDRRDGYNRDGDRRGDRRNGYRNDGIIYFQ